MPVPKTKSAVLIPSVLGGVRQKWASWAASFKAGAVGCSLALTFPMGEIVG